MKLCKHGIKLPHLQGSRDGFCTLIKGEGKGRDIGPAEESGGRKPEGVKREASGETHTSLAKVDHGSKENDDDGNIVLLGLQHSLPRMVIIRVVESATPIS